MNIDALIASIPAAVAIHGPVRWYPEFRQEFVWAFDEGTMRRLERRIHRIPHGEERFMRAILNQVEFPVSATLVLADAIKQAERASRMDVVDLGPLGFADARDRIAQTIQTWSTIVERKEES